jgi:Flp pilus assembly protein TadD
MPADPLPLARMLLDQGRSIEARDLLMGALASGHEGAPIHNLLGLVLHQLGDLPGCERELRAAVRLAPNDGAAQFALASVCFRLGKDEEAEASVRRAIAEGMRDAPVFALLGRVLGKQGRLDEAESAWRQAVRLDPASPQSQRELADVIWMQTGDVAKARAELDAAPQSPEIATITVRLLQAAGEDSAAYELAARAAAHDPGLHVLAARAALILDPQLADQHLSAAPPPMTPAFAKAGIEVDLALGRAEQAIKLAEQLRAARPNDQHVVALLATAYRLAGDARYRQLYDYERLVGTYRIQPPEGWDSLGSYLGDLARALDAVHGARTHPVDQSLRHGSQTSRNLMDYADPAIRALFAALDAPVRAHIAAIGEAHPYKIASAWSVRLKDGGFHINHVHPEGWLSSAFYVRVPPLAGQQGWLKFGEPGPPTAPPLGPEHFVRPEPGLLVLFPSYMWHGTVPFLSEQTRLTCAFDIVRS